MPSPLTFSPPSSHQGREKLHLQLASLFRNKIASGTWAVGHVIPTVDELEALHQVSRTTVRHALAALITEGLLRTRKRGGTLVLAAPYRPPSLLLPGTWEEMLAFEHKVPHEVLENETTSQPRRAASVPAGLRLAPSYQRLLRSHRHDGTAFGVSELFLEHTLYARHSDAQGGLPLGTALQAERAQIGQAHKQLRMVSADERLSALLATPLGTPLMHSVYWAATPDGQLLYWSLTYCRCEYVHMDLDLLPPSP